MIKETISGKIIIELLDKRNKQNPDEYLVIENRNVSDFHSVSCKNIWFKNCFFVDSEGDIFSNSQFENLILEDCCWYDSSVKNSYFKNITMIRSSIHNNVDISNCTFDNLIFQNSLMRFQGFENCEIKNTDFRGQEYFFLQTIELGFADRIFSSGELQNLLDVINKNKEQFVIPWYSLKYTNCIIDLESIKRLASFSNKIDPNYSVLAPTAYLTGFINLDGAEEIIKYFIIAGIFLYDAKQVYEYEGKHLNSEYRKDYDPPIFSYFKDNEIDLSKYKKTLMTKNKCYPMTIVDDSGNIIQRDQIPPIGEITFLSKPYHDMFVESNFDASTLNKNSNISKLTRSIW